MRDVADKKAALLVDWTIDDALGDQLIIKAPRSGFTDSVVHNGGDTLRRGGGIPRLSENTVPH